MIDACGFSPSASALKRGFKCVPASYFWQPAECRTRTSLSSSTRTAALRRAGEHAFLPPAWTACCKTPRARGARARRAKPPTWSRWCASRWSRLPRARRTGAPAPWLLTLAPAPRPWPASGAPMASSPIGSNPSSCPTTRSSSRSSKTSWVCTSTRPSTRWVWAATRRRRFRRWTARSRACRSSADEARRCSRLQTQRRDDAVRCTGHAHRQGAVDDRPTPPASGVAALSKEDRPEYGEEKGASLDRGQLRHAQAPRGQDLAGQAPAVSYALHAHQFFLAQHG